MNLDTPSIRVPLTNSPIDNRVGLEGGSIVDTEASSIDDRKRERLTGE
jgi:hypothetical protein